MDSSPVKSFFENLVVYKPGDVRINAHISEYCPHVKMKLEVDLDLTSQKQNWYRRESVKMTFKQTHLVSRALFGGECWKSSRAQFRTLHSLTRLFAFRVLLARFLMHPLQASDPIVSGYVHTSMFHLATRQ